MLDRPRAVVLGWAGLCFGLFAVLALAVHQDWVPVTSVDGRGEPAEGWAVDERWLRHPLRWVEIGFQSVPIIVATIVLVVLLLARGYRRAALFSVGVMGAALLAYPLLKGFFGRDRPPWQNPAQLAHSLSFPSGHATSVAALGGVLIVLVSMFVRRANLRRAAYAGVVLVVLVVGADRVLLGATTPPTCSVATCSAPGSCSWASRSTTRARAAMPPRSSR